MWRRARDLFDAALEKPSAERRGFLDAACAGDQALRREVDRLLEAHADVGSFLERPATVPSEAGGRTVRQGESIGPYRVIRELGRGGMGVVYLGARVDGAFRRQVAIKLIKPGLDHSEIVRRFRTERQILANLDHPSIARLLDGGDTEDGSPYFVVEYVEGEPIDRYCDARKLPPAERLKLFRVVCSAVQRAHQNLVVHRDLKPGNILVTADGVPKLLDFGIAKLLDPHGSSETLAGTLLGVRPLTPDYASPEQVRGGPITTATDVYALGLLLYELLTGRRAYRLESASYSPRELEELVCGQAPERPSVAVLRQERPTGEDGSPSGRTAEEISRARGCDPKGLARRLAGDLDTIVLTALRKEPERRYGSVEQLSEDVRRHLAGLPVTARPDTLWYRGGKFVRRHTLGVAATAGVVLLLLGFGTSMAIQQQQVARERDRAEQNALQMARERDKARQTRDFLVGLFEVSDPGEARGGSITARELLDRGADEVESRLQEQPEVRADLMNTIGKVYRSLGLYEPAERLLRQALNLRREGLGKDSLEVAESLNELGWLLWERGDYAAAEERYREALTMRRELLGSQHPDVARSLNGLALVLQAQGDSAGAEPLFREVLAMRRELLGSRHAEVAESLSNLALVLRAQGRYTAAEERYREALAMRRELFGEQHPDVAESLNNLAMVLYDQGDSTAAESLFREALTLFRRLLGDEHPDVAKGLNNLATVLHARGDHAGAEPLFRESLAMSRKLHGGDHPDVARTLNNLALVLRAQGDDAGAEPLYRESLAMSRRLLGEEHPSVAISMLGLGALLRDLGELGEAGPLIEGSLSRLRQLLGSDHPLVATGLTHLAELRRLQGRHEEAESNAQQALDTYKKTLPSGDRRLAVAKSILGASLVGQARFGQAEELLLDSYRDLVATGGEGDLYTRAALERLINLYQAWGRPAEMARYRGLLREKGD